MSQHFDIGLSFFVLLYVEDRNKEKITKNHKSYPFFVIKLKLKPKQKIWDTLP